MPSQPDLQKTTEYIIRNLSNIRISNIPLEFIVQLNKMTKNPNVSMSQIATLIEREPSMSAQLLRISNSAYFSRGTRICNVNQAIMLLGLDTVKRIVVASGAFDLGSTKVTFTFFDASNYLKSSIAGAIISEEVAQRAGYPQLDDVYICALLRDFGVLILKQYYPELFIKIGTAVQEKKWPFRTACLSVCGIDHHEIASRLFSQWKLPIILASACNVDETTKKGVTGMERICGHVDSILKEFEYAQWDLFGIPSEKSNLLSANKEFHELMRKRIKEAEDFMDHLSNAMQEEEKPDEEEIVEELGPTDIVSDALRIARSEDLPGS